VIPLLDEANVFLEARIAQEIPRNALISVFLRLLVLQIILFFTTNRVNSFGSAFQSRLHVALKVGLTATAAKLLNMILMGMCSIKNSSSNLGVPFSSISQSASPQSYPHFLTLNVPLPQTPKILRQLLPQSLL
jgi:hypothetical protein